jgi:diadenylate cyclase
LNEIFQRLDDLRRLTWPNLVHVVDILLVSYLLYRLLLLVRSTRAWRILIGIIIFVAILFLSDFLQLRTLHWLLEKATLLGPVALVILFLPELRQTLESIARVSLISDAALARSSTIAAKTIEEIVAGVSEMSSVRVGALIVIERGNLLEDIAANGVKVNAEVSAALLGSVFFNGNPLHDGAVVIRGDSLLAAACRLPLSDSASVDKNVHMRHRAALGIAEQTDAIVIVISEERGTVSLAQDGHLTRFSDPSELRNALNQVLRPTTPEKKSRRRRRDKQEVNT